jgi:hypothetical protein
MAFGDDTGYLVRIPKDFELKIGDFEYYFDERVEEIEDYDIYIEESFTIQKVFEKFEKFKDETIIYSGGESGCEYYNLIEYVMEKKEFIFDEFLLIEFAGFIKIIK